MILTHSKVYLVKDSYSTLKKCFLGKRQRKVQLEDSPSEQKAVKYEENMYAIGYRGKAIQKTKNECVCRCTRRGVCVCLSVCLSVCERQRGIRTCDTMCVTSLKSLLLPLDSI